MLLEFAILLLLLPVCSFAPGFFFVRRLPWNPLEKLCGSIGLSLILLYLAMWGVYCFGPRDERISCWIVVSGSVGMGAAAWNDLRRWVATFRIRQTLKWFGLLLAWTLVMLCIIRVYSGAGWSGDWLEHFQRSLFFLKRLPLSITLFPKYALTARPPMMNVLAAFFLALTSDRFEIFQVVFAYLNLLMFLPCVLILPALGGSRRRFVMPLAALFAAGPAVMEAVTYMWTKALPAFFVVLAIALYLSGQRKDDRLRIGCAFVALTAGLLVHFSAGPYVVLLGLHYSIRVVRRREWRQLAATALACGLLLSTWFGWAVAAYGWKDTLGSNTSVTGAAEHKGGNIAKIAANTFDSLVPIWLRGGPGESPTAKGVPATRDDAFVFYQLNLIFAMGVVGGPLVVWLWIRALRKRMAATPEVVFWRLLVPCCIVLGLAVVGERDEFGTPHLTLLSIEILGLSLLAAHFRSLRRPLRLLLVAGLVVDFYFGIWLQARVEGLENTAGRTVFADLYDPHLGFSNGSGEEQIVSPHTWGNWSAKWKYRVSQRLLAAVEQQRQAQPGDSQTWSEIRTELEGSLQDDVKNWGGWAGRHDGVLSYVGDWVGGETGAGNDTAGVVFCLMFAALAGSVAWAAWSPRPSIRPVRAEQIPAKRKGKASYKSRAAG